MKSIQNVLILGAGRMGSQIALQCAFSGCRAVSYDPHVSSTMINEQSGLEILSLVYPERDVSAKTIAAAMSRMVWATDLPQAAAQADLVIESVTEKLPAKRDALSRCHALCPPETIFVTNSSSFGPSSLADASGRPDRFASLHFARASGIIEIMPHPGTSAETMAALDEFSRRVGTLTLACQKEHAGHVLNTLLMALNYTALTLAENGIAAPEEIDRVWMKSTEARTGPFGILDDVGLDTAWQITDFAAKITRDPQRQRNADFLKRYVESGRLGRDCGRGFYEYPHPAYLSPDFLADQGAKSPSPPTAAAAPAAPPAEPAAQPGVAGRFVLRLVEVPHPTDVAATPFVHGPAAILGDNPLSNALRKQLTRIGVTVHSLPSASNPRDALGVLERLWTMGPIPHLFLTTAWDRAAVDYFSNPDVRRSRHQLGVVLPYLVAQKWYQLVHQAGLLERSSLVAATALGGDFGLSGNSPAVEGGGLAGLLKSIATEEPKLSRVKLIDAPLAEPADEVAEFIVRELAQGGPDVEVAIAGARRFVIRARREPAESLPRRRTTPKGAWLVTGGARGITAYAARELARRFPVTLHILGTTPLPNSPPAGGLSGKAREIETTLRTLRDAGLSATYHACDLADAAPLAEILTRIRSVDGPIRGILHGAGTDVAGKFERQQLPNVLRVLSPKLDGTANLLQLTQGDPLEFFIAFGSTSGRFGAYCNADYGLANDMLAKMVNWHRRERPECAAFTFHWTAWDDVGMCMRPASRVALAAMKVKLMPAEEGGRHFLNEILAASDDAEILITDHPHGIHSRHVTMPRE